MDPSSSSSPEEQEAYRDGGRPCYILPFLATEPAHGGGASSSASSSEGGLRSEYKPEFFPRTFASTHGRRMSQWLLPSARHVSQQVVTVVLCSAAFFRSFSAMIEVIQAQTEPV